MNKHGITKETYQYEFVIKLAKRGEAILSSLITKEADQHLSISEHQALCQKLHILHMGLGISGEAIELLEACDLQQGGTLIEEAGDTLFYAVGLAAVLDLHYDWWEYNRDGFPDRILDTGAIHFLVSAGNVADNIKKYFIYSNDEKLEEVKHHLIDLFLHIEDVCAHEGISLQQLIDHNVEKLSKRYEGLVYSDKAAAVRADKVEDVQSTVVHPVPFPEPDAFNTNSKVAYTEHTDIMNEITHSGSND